jgi:hypothetical protein
MIVKMSQGKIGKFNNSKKHLGGVTKSNGIYRIWEE